MKKSNLFLVFLMALIVMSCSKDETTMSIPQEGNAIEFGTYLGRNPKTRGAELNTGNIKTFGIFAAYTGKGDFVGKAIEDSEVTASPINFMHNQLVSGGQNSWSYTPIKYWPTTKGDKISFFAYAPHTTDGLNVNVGEGETSKVLAVSQNSVGGTPTVTYTVPTDPTKMVDFVAGVVMNRERTLEGESTVAKTVDFNLKHELTRVEFKAKASELLFATDDASKKTYINIKSARLNTSDGGNLYKSATYTFGNDDDDKGSWASGISKFSNYLIDGVLATDKTLYNEITEFLEEGVVNLYTDANEPIKGVMIGAKTTGEEGEKTHSAISIFTGNQYLFFIPAINDSNVGLKEKAATVTFDYDIVTLDKNLAKGFSVTSASKTVALPTGTLQQGVAYNYTFTFNVDQVVVSVEKVASWGTGSGNVNVDYTNPK